MGGGFRGKRIRDPVHGLIVFEQGNKRDELAWELLNTPEMQRLRRIRQLGVSEFVFPGATHSRFAHSLGVYHTAKQLVEIIRRELRRQGKENEFDQDRADEAVLAALLHDVGHGPFSHAFEHAQKARGINKRHEKWTAEIITNPNGKISRILGEDRARRIADMLQAEDPQDIYHAVFSSSFDADRLDYVQRDRMMTGTHAGHIDFDWLLDNLRVREINLGPPEDEETRQAPTFCFDPRARPAAEQFLLARYTLHEQVYFHKTTRAMEEVIKRLFRRLGELAESSPEATGLPKDHPILRFFTSDRNDIESYLALDDFLIISSLPLLYSAEDDVIRDMACRLRNRTPPKPLCVGTEFGSDQGRQRRVVERINEKFHSEIKSPYGKVAEDQIKLSIYSTVGEDEERAFKKIHIIDGQKRAKEIANEGISRLIWSMADKPKELIRYYFYDESTREEARKLAGGRRR